MEAAAYYGHLDIVRKLLEKGIATDVIYDAIADAAFSGHTDVERLLLDHVRKTAELVDECLFPHQRPMDLAAALYEAAKKGHLDIVGLLFEYGAKPDTQNESENTPIHVAMAHEDWKVANLLLQYDFEVDCKGNRGTPLHLASYFGRIEIVTLLTHKGATVNSRNYTGMTPLMLAIQNGHIHVVKLLLQRNGTLKSTHEDGRGPFILQLSVVIRKPWSISYTMALM